MLTVVNILTSPVMGVMASYPIILRLLGIVNILNSQVVEVKASNLITLRLQAVVNIQTSQLARDHEHSDFAGIGI